MTRSPSSRSPLDDPWLIGGIAGIGFVVLFIVGTIIQGNTPTFTDSAADIRAYFADDSQNYVAGDWLIGVGFLLGFLPFISVLRRLLGAVDTSGGVWANLAFAGGLAFLVLGGASGFATGALAMAEGNLDDPTLKLAVGVNDYGFTTASIGLSAMMFGLAVVVGRTGILWRWLAVLAGISAICLLISGLAPIQHDTQKSLGLFQLVGLLAAAVTVLLSSICMILRRGRNGVAAEALVITE